MTSRPNEMIAQEWTSLKTLWVTIKSAAAASPPPSGLGAYPSAAEQTVIDALFPSDRTWPSGLNAWHALNEAEQEVGRWLTPDQLPVEYAALLAIAVQRQSPGLAVYRENHKVFADATASLERKRTIYMMLLQALQSEFITARFQRRLRSDVALRLLHYGLATVAFSLVAPAIYLVLFLVRAQAVTNTGDAVAAAYNLFSDEPGFALTMVAAFGILGAYFSRVISFQSKLATLGFDDVMNLYLGRVLLLRMLYGLIGAVIFYYVLRSGLVEGPVFPNLSHLAIGGQPIWTLGADGTVKAAAGQNPAFSGLTVLAPTTELAKLLVWSFIAGFSERLVPDTLARTEAQANKAATAPQT